ncbi:MAG: hypothetical protein JSS69_02400 [Acidobacteria bacterium]|nr:hypothetical protein [Acidobacteriota bacterium]MBS1864744.1 hypothetical protein [Acidobacteriota bacterium]
MNTEILEQVQQEIQSKSPVEFFELSALRDDSAVDETAVLTAPAPIDEWDVFVEFTLIAPISLSTQPFIENWSLVEGKRVRDIEQELRAEGWHFFYIVPDLRSTAIARRPEIAIRRALAGIFQSATRQGLNTVEIASLRTRRVFGVHRAEVVARLRHIQESPYLFQTNEEMHQRMQQEDPTPRTMPLTHGFVGRSYAELHAILAGRTQ